jgi:uncharacterized caspase-like protein
MEIGMDLGRIKILMISLFIFTLCSLLFYYPAYSASRGISIISDLSHQSGKLGAYRALIIGINDYKDPKIPDLETAVNDAKAMAELLRERYGFQVKLLLDRKATKKVIYKALRSLASSTKPNDSVLIYYAGHGDLDRTYDDGWWIPADAKSGDPVTYLDNGQVQKSMRSMGARHVLLISDSCYSGTLFGQARAMPQVIDDKYYLNLYNEKSRWGMTSGNKTPVSDRGSGGHSVFAYQLLKELRKNEKPYVSTQEIYTRIAPIVGNNSEQAPLCRPVRNTGDQGGEFIFVVSSGAATDKVDTELAAERKRLEQERMELERLKIEFEREKLETERKRMGIEKQLIVEKKALEEKPQSKQLAYIPQEPLQKPPDARFTLAFFPSKIMGSGEDSVIKGFKKVIVDSQLFFPKLSYYDLGYFSFKGVASSAAMIDNSMISSDVINKFWVKESFFSQQEPNIELICTLGMDLQVDYVFLVYAESGRTGTIQHLTVFLINVKTKKLYTDNKRDVLPPRGEGITKESTILIKKFFSKIANNQSN